MFNFLKPKKNTGSSIILSLSGLHCSSCAVNIDLTLEELDGILNSKTNYAKSVSEIDFDPTLIQPQSIIAEVEKLGYSAKLIS